MKSYVVLYKRVGNFYGMYSKQVEASCLSEAACKLVREIPDAIVWGYPREVHFIPAAAELAG